MPWTCNSCTSRLKRAMFGFIGPSSPHLIRPAERPARDLSPAPPRTDLHMMLAFVGELLPRLPAVLACWLYAGAIGVAAIYGEGAPVPVRILVALLALAAGALTLQRSSRGRVAWSTR